MSTSPVKNVGSDTPSVASRRLAWSTIDPGRVAARTPRGTPTAMASNRPARVNSSEAGRRLASSRVTGWPVVSETPRSPRDRSRR